MTASSSVDRLRQAIADTLSIDAQGLQAAIGQLVVATSADYPAAGPQDRSLYSAAVRTTVLLADRIPAGQEAQALAQEIERHHGRQAAQAVLGERVGELLPTPHSPTESAQGALHAQLPAVLEALEVAGQVNAAMETLLVQYGHAMTASDRKTRTENSDRLSELLDRLHGADMQSPALQKFRVLGAHANRNFFDIEVEVTDGLKAFGAAAQLLMEAGEESDAEFYAAIPAGVAFEMPGDSVVTLGTVLDPEQADVYGLPPGRLYGNTVMLNRFMSDSPGYTGTLMCHVGPEVVQVVMPRLQDAQGNFLAMHLELPTPLPAIESVQDFAPEHAQMILDNLSEDSLEYCNNDVQAIQEDRSVIVRWENGSLGAVVFWGDACYVSAVHFEGEHKGEHAFNLDGCEELYVSREEAIDSVVGTPEQRAALAAIKPSSSETVREIDRSGSSQARGHTAYEATVEDVENVLRSNSLAVANTNGKSFESMANELHGALDFDLIEQAALAGDDLDEQTDYANDEIARQLREMGVLEPLKQAYDSPSPGM